MDGKPLTPSHRDALASPDNGTTPPAQVRGMCPACRRAITLTKAGKIRPHGAKDGSWPPRGCDGVGQDPKPRTADR